jgi:predicted molibdopterin-dependent oxidoreductase YjgC
VPLYTGIERLEKKGDNVQWGGPSLYAGGRFATPDGRARFAPVSAGRAACPPAEFRVSTRRGKQFNSMIQREVDPLTGARREDVLISPDDLERLRLSEGARVRLRSAAGSVVGRLRVAAMRPGNLEVHWPEGSPLLSASAIDPASMEPDYNATVTVEPIG